MLQTACHLWHADNKPTLYIDTESFYRQEQDRIRITAFFKKRWNIKDEPKIDFIFPESLYDIYRLLGKGLKINSDSKKLQLTPHIWSETEPNQSPLYNQVEENKYGMIIIDSLTNPIKEEIQVPPRQNFPCRAAVEAGLVGRLSPLAKAFDIPIVVTVHGTKDPTNPYDTGNPAVSSSLRYNIKHILQIRGTSSNEKRTAVRYRYPGLTSVRRIDEGEELKLSKDIGYTP